MKNIISALCFILIAQFLNAQVTFTKDIAPIIYNQCGSCHRAGEIGPMPFTNYDEVKNYAQTIRFVTATGYMPPWQADPDYSNLLEQNFLTEAQKALIKVWVDEGTVYGNAAEEPPFPDYPTGSLLGTPDLVLTMAEAHLHPGNNLDEYRYFVLPSGLTEDKIIKAIEVRPGNTKVVHHALVFEDTAGEAAASDALTPEYGFEGFGGFSGGGDIADVLNQKQYPGYVPGQKPIFYPDGMGQTLHAGADVVVQMHYAPWPTDIEDQSSVNIFFVDPLETVDRFVENHILAPLPGVLDDLFLIQPQETKTFTGTWELTEDLSFIGISPHMHLLGTDWEVYIEHADGTQTNMISIPEWDFNWQGDYYFPKFKIGKAGDKVIAKASYDNTSENPSNPSNPPVWVSWGEFTTDEMFYLPLFFVPYQDGDESIIFDATLGVKEHDIKFKENRIEPISPNPVSGMVKLGFELGQGTPVTIQITDMNGQLVRKIRNNEFFRIGQHLVNFQTADLAAGTYMINILGNTVKLSQTFIKL